MSKINEYCGEDKLAILKEYEAGWGSRSEIACKYNINVSTLKEWRRRYELYGVEGLAFRAENKSYSMELKLQAVQDYLSGKY
ncbi:helix-turn-helix domain-containing protein [Paenibacillus filicis]|uniref:Helix-turn-helix domain-containing protein n=1 Tax=Paenibacillus filicis TaxID=669464 RepID=A0ABU9DKR9_9BACL